MSDPITPRYLLEWELSDGSGHGTVPILLDTHQRELVEQVLDHMSSYIFVDYSFTQVNTPEEMQAAKMQVLSDKDVTDEQNKNT